MAMSKFGLIGGHLKHSFSKEIHKRFGNYEYDLLETTEDQLYDRIHSSEYAGFNVTIPYKKTAMGMCDEISEEVMKIGSVNTIVKREGVIKGYNTDYYGFAYLLKRNEIDVTGRKCLVLGSGGASVTVQAYLKDHKASEIIVVSRTGENNYDNIYEKHTDSEIIINTTPVGMYPDNGKTLISVDKFPALVGAVDVIYNPNKTKFILDALSNGITACGGLSMLVAQAKAASELFQNKTIDDDEVDIAIEEIRSETLNYVLIGMPGAGKTYLGRKMAERVGRDFYDLDDLIVEKEGRSIPEIFATDGEEYFRNVETELLKEVCKKNGIVLACGGGVVKRQVNYSIVKQNGRIIWVKRDLDKLETEGRPISQKKSVYEIFEERKDAYEYWSDYFIDNNQDFN